jgi:hypothetical protein
LTFNKTLGQGSLTTWVGFLTQKSENGADGDVDSQGLSYGINGKIAGFSLTGSGFTGKGIGKVLGPGLAVDTLLEAGDEVDSSGYLVQASYTINKVKLVGSYGKSKLETATELEDATAIGAIFYTINDNLKLEAEYNVETITAGGNDDTIKTIATGVILNF